MGEGLLERPADLDIGARVRQAGETQRFARLDPDIQLFRHSAFSSFGELQHRIARHVAKGRGRHAVMPGKGAREGLRAAIARPPRHTGKRQAPGDEIGGGPVQAIAPDRVGNRLSRLGAVDPVEVERGETRRLGKRGDVERTVEMRRDVIDDAGDPPGIVAGGRGPWPTLRFLVCFLLRHALLRSRSSLNEAT